MNKFIKTCILSLMAMVMLSSCERVMPNYVGVLMENYGKNGKEDFKIVTGKVATWQWGTELYQTPTFDQRGGFTSNVTLKASDNTEFSARPSYSYKVIRERAVDIVFDNKHIKKADTDSGKDGFMQSLEDNILEPRIFDLIKEESRKYKTDSLMAEGGSLVFEKKLEKLVKQEFEKKGLELITFSAQLEFSDKVKDKIDNRNEVNTNISVLEQKIEEQKMKNELEKLQTEQALIKSKGLTKEILYQQFIEKWDGHSSIFGAIPDLIRVEK